MLNKDELQEEIEYLNNVQDTIDLTINVLNQGIAKSEQNLSEVSKYISLSFYEMDYEETAVQRSLLEKIQLDNVALYQKQRLLNRQSESPYFGRIDFISDDEQKMYNIYVGISHLGKAGQEIPLVLDWRAPICSLYYDYQVGKASYTAPMGEISGEMTLKRQFKTNHRVLEYAFDSSLTINDEILRQTLAQSSDNKMGNIVATIQTEQNKIIRSGTNKNIIVQGVAGSGKTSIALHRVAYLLYNEKLSSKDILILSPSNLFSNYISNVLPELGEENTYTTTFDEIAKKEFKNLLHFQSKSEMLEDILINKNSIRIKDIQYKNSFEFYQKIKKYFEKDVNATFHANNIKFGKKIFKAEEINYLYNTRYQKHKPSVKIEWIADYIVDQLNMEKANEKSLFLRIKKILYGMFENSNILSLYSNFLQSLGMKFEMQKVENSKHGIVYYEDVAPLLYIKNFLLGIDFYDNYKHLVIDEMQDYSPLAMHLINILFPCPKTILGDIHQCLEKNLNNDYLTLLAKEIGNSKIFNLTKTYRSTYEIATYSQNIINLQEFESFNRQGEPVEVTTLESIEKLFEKINDLLNELQKTYENIAIITPTQSLANTLGAKLQNKFNNIKVIDKADGDISQKINVIPVVFSKGLEFDVVISVEQQDLNNSIDLKEIYKNINYVSSTRALHKLVVIKV